MILIILKSILAQIVILLGMLTSTICGYIYSYFGTTHKMIIMLTNIISVTRKIVFFIVGVKIQYNGTHNIPEGPCVFACKHQSLIETTFFFNIFKPYTVYAYKREISDVILWGKISKVFGGIKVDRALGGQIIDSIVEQAKDYLSKGFSITIFPEGTRVKAGVNGRFKRGISKIYANINHPVVPVAINTGVILPRKSFLLYPATLIVEFLPPMPQNLTEEQFLQQLEDSVNSKSQELFLLTKSKFIN